MATAPPDSSYFIQLCQYREDSHCDASHEEAENKGAPLSVSHASSTP
jgi:hypothetical protein